MQNAPFCPIPTSGLNFNPQNTQCILAEKIWPFLALSKIEHFSKIRVVDAVISDQALTR
jgi:hypothetical protein